MASLKTVEECEERLRELDKEGKAHKEEVRKVSARLQELAIEDAAQRRVEAMSAAERAALVKIVSANGIKSGESVGSPGQ